ncbi:ExeA family protein [Desulfocurvibacter africanus]|uniref:ExeA family protein n=1 Tax=Desulfocurvibacter africanus TaxID=873 RepID=UPI00040055D2|nr:AAA family ATPase [Desulfocurvibacter africanus]
MLKRSPKVRSRPNPAAAPAPDQAARAAGMAAAMRAFANAPGSTFFYSGAVHKQLLEGLVRALRDRLGLHLVLGDFGTGKTTLCNFVLMAYGHEFVMGYLGNPFVDETEFFRQIAAALGVEAPETASAKECLDALEGFLRRQHMERKVCVVFVDEAHLLDPALLDRLLVLSNLQISGVPLLQVVLAGVPGLLDLLATPRFGSLNQRIGSRHWLQPLGKAELNEYVRHRLAHAGSDQELFSPRALSAVQRRSGGRPRLVNMLCRLSLEVCARSGKSQVSPAMVRLAAAGPAYDSLFREAGMRRGRWLAWMTATPLALAVGLALLLVVREVHVPELWRAMLGREKMSTQSAAAPAAEPSPLVPAVPAVPPVPMAGVASNAHSLGAPNGAAPVQQGAQTSPQEIQAAQNSREPRTTTGDGWRTLPDPVDGSWALETTPEPEIRPGMDDPSAVPALPEGRSPQESELETMEQLQAEDPPRADDSQAPPARPAPPPPEEVTRALVEKLEPIWGPIRHGQDLPPELAKARVQAIAWSAVPEERMALVGEAIVRIGETLAGGNVAAIGEEYVLVVMQGERYLLQIMPRR